MKTRASTLVEVVILLAIIAILATFPALFIYRERVEMPRAFAAWEKLTGNPKHLTFAEWRALVRAHDQQATNTIILRQ